MTIFDLIVSNEIVSYWELLTKERAPYMGEELFPSDKKLGLDLKWLKGSKGLPVVNAIIRILSLCADAPSSKSISSAKILFTTASMYV